MDYAAETNIDRMGAANQRAIDEEGAEQDRLDALITKAERWIKSPLNMLELSGWFSDEQYVDLARLDALINSELSRPYTGANMRETEVGIREYAENKREIFLDCAMQYAADFNYFNDEGVQ